MTSIDDIFKKPNLPSKRKLEVSHDPADFYKSAKHSEHGDAKGGLHASAEDVMDEDDDDIEAGPAPPPDEEEEGDYGPEDDEDGRFFGGGVNRSGKAAMEYLDAQSDDENVKDETYDVGWLRKFALSFEKKISKNAELRAKFEDDPKKFMASEADLDDAVKDLSILSSHPELYKEFAKLGCVASLVGLLAHENADIAIDAIAILNELTDDDVEAEKEQWDALVDAALEADLLDLLSQNLERLDESQKADEGGVSEILDILESFASEEDLSNRVAKDKKLMQWLLKRISKEEIRVSTNKQSAADVISIIVLLNSVARNALIELGAVDTILQLLAPYRRRDPEDKTDEQGFVEDLFQIMDCLVQEPAGKEEFVKAEGVELALIMMRQGKMSKDRGLALLDYASGLSSGVAVCERIVEAQGLKTIFGLFMKKHDPTTTSHYLTIFASLLRNLPAESDERIRLLAKFVEKDYEKIDMLFRIRTKIMPKLSTVTQDILIEMEGMNAEEQAENAEEWRSRRRDAGLFNIETIDTILVWLYAEDKGAQKRIQERIEERDGTLADIRETLEERLEQVDDVDDESKLYKEMMEALIDVLH
jgi:beta-catenin-like protein 1